MLLTGKLEPTKQAFLQGLVAFYKLGIKNVSQTHCQNISEITTWNLKKLKVQGIIASHHYLDTYSAFTLTQRTGASQILQSWNIPKIPTRCLRRVPKKCQAGHQIG